MWSETYFHLRESVKFVHSQVLGRIFAEAFAEIEGKMSFFGLKRDFIL